MVMTGKLIYTDDEKWYNKEEIAENMADMSEQSNNHTVNVNISIDEWKMVQDYQKWKLKKDQSGSEPLKSEEEDCSRLGNFGVNRIIPESTIMNTDFTQKDTNLDTTCSSGPIGGIRFQEEDDIINSVHDHDTIPFHTNDDNFGGQQIIPRSNINDTDFNVEDANFDTNCSSAPSRGIHFQYKDENVISVQDHDDIPLNTSKDDRFSDSNDLDSIHDQSERAIYGADDMALALLWEEKEGASVSKVTGPKFVPLTMGKGVSLNTKDLDFFSTVPFGKLVMCKIYLANRPALITLQN